MKALEACMRRRPRDQNFRKWRDRKNFQAPKAEVKLSLRLMSNFLH